MNTIVIKNATIIGTYHFRDLDKSLYIGNDKGEHFVIGCETAQLCCESFIENLDEIRDVLLDRMAERNENTVVIYSEVVDNEERTIEFTLVINGEVQTLSISNDHNGYYAHAVTFGNTKELEYIDL